jgi:acyl-CoA thioesterase
MNLFDLDVRLDEHSHGQWTADISDRWSIRSGTPNGGFLLGICVQALGRELPFPDPLVVSGYFLRAGQVGVADLDVAVAREGRRMATGECSLRQAGKEIVRTVATFADLGLATGRTHLVGLPPKLPAPEDCLDLFDGTDSRPAGVSIADRFECRFAELPGWRTGSPGGDPSLEFWMRFADGREPDSMTLPMLVDAAAPVVWEIGEFVSSTVELTVHVRARPAPGWLACRVQTRYVQCGYHEEDFEIWDSTGTLVAQSRQLAIL